MHEIVHITRLYLPKWFTIRMNIFGLMMGRDHDLPYTCNGPYLNYLVIYIITAQFISFSFTQKNNLLHLLNKIKCNPVTLNFIELSL